MIKLTPVCPYCKSFSKRVTGEAIYPHRKDLYSLTFYQCEPCRAYVGTHKNSDGVPLGRLANASLRAAKSGAHREFDQLWRDGLMKRKEAYKWLADQLCLDKKDCHIGMFDIGMCKTVRNISLDKWLELNE